MVPHVRLEELLHEIIGPDAEGPRAAVVAVHDEKKGERLVVLHCGLPLLPEVICRQLIEKGLPPLWVPSPDSFRQVAAIPLLGSGKLDLAGLQALARAEFPGPG